MATLQTSFQQAAALTVFTAVLLSAGCEREPVRVYQVAKEQPFAPADATAVDTDQRPPTPHWKIPAAWQVGNGPSVRIATFVVSGKNGAKAEVAVTAFPGTVGTELDNVNRWRRELELPAVTEADVKSDPIPVGNQPGRLYEMVSAHPLAEATTPVRTMAVSVSAGSMTWFFKIKGDDETVRDAKNDFVAFLSSVEFPVAEQPGRLASTTSEPPSAENKAGLQKFELPAGWTEQAPGPMILQRFRIAGEGAGSADVTTSTLSGDGGGMLANVNRWRGQLGLQPTTEADLGKLTTSTEIGGAHATMVDFSGIDSKTAQKARLVAVMLPKGGQVWFFKLMGDESTVGKRKDEFLGFLKALKFE